MGSQGREKNPNWKGGRTLASSGYYLVKIGIGTPGADVRGYAYEHRLVAEKTLGRPLQKGEIVHHRNGDRLDNRPENLEVLPSIAHHMREHAGPSERRAPGEENPTIACGCGCGETFPKFDGGGRPRRFVSGHNLAVA